MITILDLLIPPAFADTVGAAPASGNYSLFLMMAFIILFTYFAMIRPQNKRAREMQALIAQLAEGDEVLTSCGLIGKIAKLQENYIQIEIQAGVLMTMEKSSVTRVLPKGTFKSLT